MNVVSQIQWMDQYQTYGLSAHPYADHVATRSLKVFWPRRKIGMVVRVAKRLFMLSRIHAEA